MNLPSESMLENWAKLGTKIALALIVLSSLYYILYVVFSSSISNRSKKHKFVLNNEVKSMWIAAIGFSAAISIIVNIVILHDRDFHNLFVFILKAGLAIGVGVTVGYAVRAYLKVYYPSVLDRKISDIRFKERKNPKTGNSMKLLNEEEEDKYLTEEMIRQEDELKYDFDVWLDEKSGETIIETYTGSTNRECQRCHFRTMKLVSEEIDTETKENILYFKCYHCGNKLKEIEQK